MRSSALSTSCVVRGVRLHVSQQKCVHSLYGSVRYSSVAVQDLSGRRIIARAPKACQGTEGLSVIQMLSRRTGQLVRFLRPPKAGEGEVRVPVHLVRQHTKPILPYAFPRNLHVPASASFRTSPKHNIHARRLKQDGMESWRFQLIS